MSDAKRSRPHPTDQPPPKRQKLTNLIINQFQNTLQNTIFNDVEFVVGTSDNQQTFSANKLVFSTQSEPFKAMLYGPLSRSNNEAITIPDVTPAAFGYLHKVFYMKQPKLTLDIIIDVLYAAKKYMIDIVINECKQTLSSIDNIDDIYTILDVFGQHAPSIFDEDIQHFIKNTKFIKQNIRNILEDSRFMSLAIFIIQYIIESNLISSEQLKYEQCKKYCIYSYQHMDININKHDSWKQIFCQHFLKKIDLKTLSLIYLLSTVRNDSIISSDHLLDILCEQQKEREQLNVQCLVCHKTGNLYRCSQCKMASYCSKEHQVVDWERHSTECQ